MDYLTKTELTQLGRPVQAKHPGICCVSGRAIYGGQRIRHIEIKDGPSGFALSDQTDRLDFRGGHEPIDGAGVIGVSNFALGACASVDDGVTVLVLTKTSAQSYTREGSKMIAAGYRTSDCSLKQFSARTRKAWAHKISLGAR